MRCASLLETAIAKSDGCPARQLPSVWAPANDGRGGVRRLTSDGEHNITVGGPELAAQAIRADLVDVFQMIVCPVAVGSGKR
jgi:riboflavin biosynthesis pyrimidine reductase